MHLQKILQRWKWFAVYHELKLKFDFVLYYSTYRLVSAVGQ